MVAEGVEPNPGPRWENFLLALKEELQEEYSEDLDKILIKAAEEAMQTNPLILLAEKVLEFLKDKVDGKIFQYLEDFNTKLSKGNWKLVTDFLFI